MAISNKRQVETKQPNRIDSLEFRLIDPVAAKEDWIDLCDNPPNVVEIYINGVELISILKPIEKPFYEAENWKQQKDGGYGHIEPDILYDLLAEALIEGSYSNTGGVEALCCSGCGEFGCWSVEIFVTEDDDYIYWGNFSHNHRDWEYGLSYKFEKSAYNKEMEKLKSFIKE